MLAIANLRAGISGSQPNGREIQESIPEWVWCGEARPSLESDRYGFSILALLLTSSPSV